MARRLFLYKNEGTAVISGTGTVVMLPEVSEGYSASFQVLLEKAAEALRVGESGVALFALNGSPIRQRQLWEIPGENADLIVVPNTEDCHQRSLSTAAPPMLSGYAVLSWIKGHHGELQHLTVEEIAYSMGLPPAVAPHCEGHESGSEAAVCQVCVCHTLLT